VTANAPAWWIASPVGMGPMDGDPLGGFLWGPSAYSRITTLDNNARKWHPSMPMYPDGFLVTSSTFIYESVGREFDSLRAHFNSIIRPPKWAAFDFWFWLPFMQVQE